MSNFLECHNFWEMQYIKNRVNVLSHKLQIKYLKLILTFKKENIFGLLFMK